MGLSLMGRQLSRGSLQSKFPRIVVITILDISDAVLQGDCAYLHR